MRASSGVTYLHGDHLGSTSVTTDPSSSQRYYPFGQTRGTGTVGTNYRFTGQRWQDDVKLYYYNARWYHAGLGRFVQADSIVPEPGNPQSLNRYAYCLNNPLRYVDPTGQFSVEELLAYGISQDTINQWMKDLAWWAFISEARFGDHITAINPFTSGKPQTIAGLFGLYGGRLTFFERGSVTASWSVERFASVARSMDIQRLNGGGEWQSVGYSKAFLTAAPPRSPELYFDADAVDWLDVAFDVAGLAALGGAKLARAGSNAARTAETANAWLSVYQLELQALDFSQGRGEVLSLVLNTAGAIPIPLVSVPANIISLGVDLKKGIKTR